MTYRVGSHVRTLPWHELRWMLDNNSNAFHAGEYIRYFSFRNFVFFGCEGYVTDAWHADDGTELYRLSLDHGENVWDSRLLRLY